MATSRRPVAIYQRLASPSSLVFSIYGHIRPNSNSNKGTVVIIFLQCWGILPQGIVPVTVACNGRPLLVTAACNSRPLPVMAAC